MEQPCSQRLTLLYHAALIPQPWDGVDPVVPVTDQSCQKRQSHRGSGAVLCDSELRRAPGSRAKQQKLDKELCHTEEAVGIPIWTLGRKFLWSELETELQ